MGQTQTCQVGPGALRSWSQHPRVPRGPTWRHHTMAAAHPPCLRPTPEEVLPLFRSLFSRPLLKQWLAEVTSTSPTPLPRLYWRLFTPLIVLWCLIMQRLQADQTDDAVVSQLHTGAADALDAHDPHPQPLSQRLHSESSSAYAQARARLPLAVLRRAIRS